MRKRGKDQLPLRPKKYDEEKVFAAVLEHRGVTRAAQVLGMPHQSVSFIVDRLKHRKEFAEVCKPILQQLKTDWALTLSDLKPRAIRELLSLDGYKFVIGYCALTDKTIALERALNPAAGDGDRDARGDIFNLVFQSFQGMPLPQVERIAKRTQEIVDADFSVDTGHGRHGSPGKRK